MRVKKPVTMRLDPELLAAARRYAKAENRSLTNFIETLLLERVAASAPHTPIMKEPSMSGPFAKTSSHEDPLAQ